MRLRDKYDGGDDPFEGDRTIVWRSLPANALVTKATVTVEPVPPPGAGTYTETLRFGPNGAAFGATIQEAATDIVEVNFHARRTATGWAGLTGINPQTLGVDVGGGVFLAVGKDGTVPAPQGSNYNFSGGVLPGIGAQRLRLANATLPNDHSSVTVDIVSMPSNLTLRFGKLPPFWSKTGELGVAATTPDITNAIQRAIGDATVTNGFYAIPLVVHSDTLGRLAITLDVEYLGTAPLVARGLPEVLLSYDFASVTTTDPSALRATLPARAAPVSPQTALQIRGAFDPSRVAYGPTGTTTESTTIHCSANETLAQPVLPPADVNVSSFDLYVAADGPAARIALDLHADFDGKPAQTSLLAKAVPFDLTGDASGQRHWTNVPLATAVQLKTGIRYWVIVEALDGAAFLGVDTPPASDRILQRSTDSGFSWRAAGLSSPLLLRLRTVPARFQMPIDFVAGTGAQAQRASLSAYDALGKIDAVIDRPEIAAAVHSYVAQTGTPSCPAAELLQNSDFTQWTATGTGLTAAEPILVTIQQSLGLFDTFFDALVAPLSPEGASPQALAYSPDGATLYVAIGGDASSILTVDTATLAVNPLTREVAAVAIAIDPRGRTLYAIEESSGGSDTATADNSSVVALDLTTKPPITKPPPTLFSLSGGAALAVSHDGTNLYAAGDSEIVGFDLVTGNERYRLAIASAQPALALTSDDATVVAVDQTAGRVVALDAATGSQRWAASLPPPSGFSGSMLPLGVAIAADGVTVYAVGLFVPAGSLAVARAAASPPVVLSEFDANGRLLPPSVRLPLDVSPAARSRPIAIAVKPQGDRIYVATTPLALDPAGGRLTATGRLVAGATVDNWVVAIARVAVGDRRPANWTLTAGQIEPVQSSDNPSRIEAKLTNGSLSQVAAVAAGCSHDFTVASVIESASETGATADAVAEIFWLNATGTLLRGDSVTLPPSTNVVTRRNRFVAPAASAQAELWVRVAGGDCVLQMVSLKSTDTSSQVDAWQPDPSTGSLLAITHDAVGTTYRNIGTANGAVVQKAALKVAGAYALDFAGRVVVGAANALPSIAVCFQDANDVDLGATQQIELDPHTFAAQPAQLTAPASSATATMRIVLPAGAALTVERLSLASQPTVDLPCSFIAQSPGELHVSNARIVYDLQPVPLPQPPPGGLSSPTPPGATPGDGTQTCAPDGTQSSVIGEPAPGPALPAPAAVRMTPPTVLAATVPEPALTAVRGIGPAREQQLIAAGITTIRDLAAATPETVADALGPLATVELGRTLIEAAMSALTPEDSGGGSERSADGS